MAVALSEVDSILVDFSCSSSPSIMLKVLDALIEAVSLEKAVALLVLLKSSLKFSLFKISWIVPIRYVANRSLSSEPLKVR